MTREEAIDNLSVAFGELRDEVRWQARLIQQVIDDKEKINEIFRKLKVLAKQLPRQDRKSYVSPYAKFDKIRKQRNGK